MIYVTDASVIFRVYTALFGNDLSKRYGVARFPLNQRYEREAAVDTRNSRFATWDPVFRIRHLRNARIPADSA